MSERKVRPTQMLARLQVILDRGDVKFMKSASGVTAILYNNLGAIDRVVNADTPGRAIAKLAELADG